MEQITWLVENCALPSPDQGQFVSDAQIVPELPTKALDVMETKLSSSDMTKPLFHQQL